jgi:predicted small lipoprotein YifL
VLIALLGAVAVSLLAGCGRKGPLEPPPSASLTQTDANPQPGSGEVDAPTLFAGEASRRPKTAAPTPPPPGKPFFLDWLLR